MKILVIGGTGKVGVAVVSNLLEQGMGVTVLTKSEDRRHLVPEKADVAIGDLVSDPRALSSAFEGADAVFMVNKASATEAVEGMLAVRLAQEAGVRRFVYQTAHLLDELAYLPHLGPKVAIRKAIELSGMDYSFIAPNHFFQNDLITQRAVLERGVYLTPLGTVGCDGVDTGDIAAVAVATLTSDGHGGRTYNVVGPELLVSEAAAQAWSNALGREIRVGSIEEWEAFTRPFMPAWIHYDLTLMYQDFAQRGMLGTPEDLADVTAILGRPPRNYRDYVAQQVAEMA